MGILAEGVSGEPPWSPVDPLQLYGSGAALIGDVNKDGFPDMVLGTPRLERGSAHLPRRTKRVPARAARHRVGAAAGESGTLPGHVHRCRRLEWRRLPRPADCHADLHERRNDERRGLRLFRRATGRRREPGRQQRDLVRERRFSQRAVRHFGGGGRPQPRRLQRHHCERALLSELGGLQSPVGPRVRLSRLVERTARTGQVKS